MTNGALAGRGYFCAEAASGASHDVGSDRRYDSADASYYPGFAPVAATLIAPANGAVLKDTAPVLT